MTKWKYATPLICGAKAPSKPQELIRKELNEPKAQVAAIGLAGENRVYMASIEQGRSSASRGGIGAVMGDKGIKAIAVRGTKDINLARPAEFMKLCNEVMQYIKCAERKSGSRGNAHFAGARVAAGDEAH